MYGNTIRTKEIYGKLEMFLPPFPFPDQWDRVKKIQNQNQEVFWSVPIDQPNLDIHNSIHSQPDENETCGPLEEQEIDDGGEEGMEEILEMNEEWANRLSATMERMKRKRKIGTHFVEDGDGGDVPVSQKKPKKKRGGKNAQKKKNKKNNSMN